MCEQHFILISLKKTWQQKDITCEEMNIEQRIIVGMLVIRSLAVLYRALQKSCYIFIFII